MGVGLSYKVRSIPATFLIGPDGRILAKNLRGAELKEAIRMALPPTRGAENEPVRDMAGFLRGLVGCLDRAGPHRQMDRRAGPGLAGAWDARGAESAMARRALAIGRRRAGAGGLLSVVPPIVTYRLVPRDQPSMEVRANGIRRRDPWRSGDRPGCARAGIPAGASLSDGAASHPGSGFPSGVAGIAAGRPPGRIRDQGSPRIPWGARDRLGLWSIWLAGVLVLTARLILASLALARLVRRSSDVPEAIVGECRAIAERLGCRRARPRAPDVGRRDPLPGRDRRPVLLLPERECETVRPDDLRAILAHELAHARNHDLAWNLAAHLASILLWFHPLAWRIRAAHAAACDAVCDAVAADLLGDVASYGRTLARLAVRAARPAPAHGLAMARTSDVRRRLDALNRRVFRTPLSVEASSCPRSSSAACSLVLIGGFGFTRAEQAATLRARPARPRDHPRPRQSAGKTDAPRRRGGDQSNRSRACPSTIGEPLRREEREGDRHDRQGRDWRRSIIRRTSRIEYFESPPASRSSYPSTSLWDDKRHPLELPPTKELRFEPGTTIGGIVKDEAGHPIEGAAVDVHGLTDRVRRRRTMSSRSGTSRRTPRADGDWTSRRGTSAASGCNVEHPRYRRNGGVASRNLDSVDRPHEGADGDRPGRRRRGPAGQGGQGHHRP